MLSAVPPPGSRLLNTRYRPALGRRSNYPLRVHLYVQLTVGHFNRDQRPVRSDAGKPCKLPSEWTFGDLNYISDVHRAASDSVDEVLLYSDAARRQSKKFKKNHCATFDTQMYA